MAAFTGLKAFSNLSEQRSSQMRQPVHFEASAVIGSPFLLTVKSISIFLLVVVNQFSRGGCGALDTGVQGDIS